MTDPAYDLTDAETIVILDGGPMAVVTAQRAIQRCLKNASDSNWVMRNQREYP